MPIAFEWSERKSRANQRKHRVSFAEAASVFSDPLARIFVDENHSGEERREIIIGHSMSGMLLLVSFTEMMEGRIRIISARRATKKEQRGYEEHTAT